MQNLESVAQKMAELPLDARETPPSDTPDQKKILIICWDSPYDCDVMSAKLGELAISCSKLALMTGGWSIENLERRLIINS